MNILSSGGLGDSLMVFAKYAHLRRENIHVVHVEPYQNTLENVEAFLTRNNVKCKIIKGRPNDFYNKNKNVFQRAFSSYAYGNKSGATNHITGAHWPPSPHKELDCEIDPFPFLQYKVIGGSDIVVCVAAGRNSSRIFSSIKIADIVRKNPLRKITLIGKVSSDIASLYKFSYRNIHNLINKTTIEEAMDIIGSCNEFYGHAGFLAYFAAMCKKRTYMIPEHCSNNYIHRAWDLKLIGV